MKENPVSESVFEAIIAYHENKLSQAQAEELISWIEGNDENLKYFLECGNLWYASGLLKKRKVDSEKGWNDLMGRIREYDERPVPKKVVRIRYRNLYLIAASLALLITVGVLGSFYLRGTGIKPSRGFCEALAPKGSRSVITLSDGSRIWLNSGTRLVYPTDFGARTRDLTLEGEAYFSVAENKNMPFRVTAGNVCITALGTAFNVKAYNEENVVETTLERGKVVVENINNSGKSVNGTQVVLLPDQKAVFVKSSGNLSVNNVRTESKIGAPVIAVKPRVFTIKVDTLVDTKLSTSWKDSRWIFKSEVLHNLAPILERRYDINIVFRDTVLNNYKFTGTIKEESLEQVLKALTLAAPIRYEVSHSTVYLFVDQSQRYKYLRQLN